MIRRKITAGLLVAASTTAVSVASHAQELNQAANEEPNRIVVTGSRVIMGVESSPTPLTVVTTDELEATTPTNIPDALNKLPVFIGSDGQRNETGGRSNSAGNFLNLRGFGVERTLTLFNGHRVVSASQNGAVDANSIPSMLVERVDVVTGGASAVYGSDAITGVVNYVLDTDFTGIKVEGNFGISNDGERPAYRAGVAGGASFADGRGHILASFRHTSQDAVKYVDLPYGPRYWGITGSSNNPNAPATMTPDSRNFWAPTGYVSGCGEGCEAARLHFEAPGILGPYNPGLPTGSSNVRMGGDGGYAKGQTSLAGLTTYEGFARLSYDVSDDVNVYVQSSLVRSNNWGFYWDPNIDTGVDRNVFFKDNPFLSQQAMDLLNTGTGDTFTIEKILHELDSMGNRGENTQFTVEVGATGTIGDRFNWDVYFSRGRNHLFVTNYNNINNRLLMAAEDAVIDPETGWATCYVQTVPEFRELYNYDECVPVNPFGLGQASKISHDFWAPDTHFDLDNTLDNIGGSIAGEAFDLPAGPVRVALSGEARWQSLEIDSDATPFTYPADPTGLRLHPANLPVDDPNYIENAHVNEWVFATLDDIPRVTQSVWEVAVEAGVPILADVSFAQSLSLNLAGRYTNYKTSGGVWSWKVGADYAVNDSIRFRGTVSQDIRAPTLTDLFGPFQASVGGYEDLLTGIGANTTVQLNPSNPDLVPEVSRTYTAGVVLTPTFLDRFTLAVDWYRITIDNAITSVSGRDGGPEAECYATAPAYDSPFCDLIVRPFDWSNTGPENFVTLIRADRVNAARQVISGFDVEASYNFDLGPGVLSLRSLANIQPTNETQALENSPVFYPAQPKTRITSFASYDVADWTFSVQNRWLSGWDKSTTDRPQYFAEPRVRAFSTTDLSINRNLDIGNINADVYLNVENVLDDPGVLWGGYAGSPGFSYPVNSVYPILGRVFTLGFRAEY